MSSFISFCLFIVLKIIIASNCYESCYVYDKDGEKHLGTKTPYRIIANEQDSLINYEGCHPIKIIGIFRHGTRTPGQKAIKKIKKHLGKIKEHILLNGGDLKNGELCEYDLKYIEDWELLFQNEEDKILTQEGEDEMIKLAKRFQNRFPSLLKQHYSNNSFLFRFTDTQRTRESAKFFTRGLFGDKKSQDVWYPHAIYKDPVLRFYKLCDKWRFEIKKNPSSLRELNMYLQTEEVEDMIQRISKRIGFNHTLKYEDVHLMYITCSFETAWNKHKHSPWCSMFSKNDLKVIEYAEELKYYWIDGYGYAINYNQACPLIKNVFSVLRSKDGPTSVFYFTHSGTILKTLSYLGLYKDEYKLTHNIKDKLKDNRKWKISEIDPFSSNLVFVLYNCEDELKVLLLHQERIIRFPGCGEGDMCALNKLKKLLKSENNCDFTNMCSLKNNKE